MDTNRHFVKWFGDIDKTFIPQIGEKAGSLGEMYSLGLPIPNGFILTPSAYAHFIKQNKLDIKIRQIFSTANVNHLKSLYQVSVIVQKLITDATFPDDLVNEIVNAYKKLGEPLVSVKFSEMSNFPWDSQLLLFPHAILNLKGEAVLLDKIKLAWSYQFNPKEIFLRYQQNQDDSKIQTSLIIQQMVESEKSGEIYTIDTRTGDKNLLVIKAILGLGELLTLNKVEPDSYEIRKSDLSIVNKMISPQKKQLKKVGTEDKEIGVNNSLSMKQKIPDNKILELAKLSQIIEKYNYFPQKIEWSLANDKFYIIQTTPLQHPIKDINNKLTDQSDIVIKGIPVNKGISSGRVRIVISKEDAEKITFDDIVVIKEIKSFFLESLKKASAIVIENFDKNLQILFESKGLRLPCIANATGAVNIFKQDEIVTVNATKGEVYKGGLSIKSHKYNLSDLNLKVATKIYLKTNYRDDHYNQKADIVEGVFIDEGQKIIESIGVHPKKLIEQGKQNVLIDKLAEYLISVCNTFPSKSVIYQFTNFTTSEYRRLQNGNQYEPIEENPATGYRGAFRFIHDPEIFNLELEAIKKVLDKINIKSLSITIPYLRTSEELKVMKKQINQSGLFQSNDLKLFITVDVPLNIAELDKFIQAGIDGLLINYGTLVSLLTGTDKNNSEILAELNKYNSALIQVSQKIISTASNFNLPVIVFNQDFSDFEELVNRLLPSGLTAICVPLEYVSNAHKILLQAEKKFINKT